MNKTININLACTFFHIDENAYETLKIYLNKLEKAFTQSKGKEEILRDVVLNGDYLYEPMLHRKRIQIKMKRGMINKTI